MSSSIVLAVAFDIPRERIEKATQRPAPVLLTHPDSADAPLKSVPVLA